MKLKHLAWLGFILILAACGTPAIPTPGPTPGIINIYYPAALQPWADKLSGCAENERNAALFFTQADGTVPNLARDDILLAIGDPSKKADALFLAQVGWEQVVVIANQSNPITQLSVDQLDQIFTGRVSTWENGPAGPIQVWVLPPGDPIEQIFTSALGLDRSIAADAMLAPDSAGMLEAVATNKDAIGYLPQSYLGMNYEENARNVKVIRMDPALDNKLHQPVIAITQQEPSGYSRKLLVCVQANSNPSK